jgi:hypothetical protein
MNVVRRLVVGSVRRGTTASLPSGAWSKSACRIGRSSGVIGTMRTAWPSSAAVRGGAALLQGLAGRVRQRECLSQ